MGIPRTIGSSKLFTYIGTASLLTAATLSRSQNIDRRPAVEVIGTSFHEFLSQVRSDSDKVRRNEAVDQYLGRVQTLGSPVIEESTVVFLYRGNARHVVLAGDLNGWNPAREPLARVEGTDLFYIEKNLDKYARIEYKLVVDSTWILDPLNKRVALGGYGANSDLWMPQYMPPGEILFRKDIPHGSVDTLVIESSLLKRSHPVFVYLPPDYGEAQAPYPSMYVTDGGEYISLGLMVNVLDNLIAEKRIEPIIGIFVDPRTDVRDSKTSRRMSDYTMSDTFIQFLSREVRGRLLQTYRLDPDPHQTAIMGASLGALIATYAVFTAPEVFGLCAAQSPSYWWNKSAILTQARHTTSIPVKMYIDTGTILDAQEESRTMRDILLRKGCNLSYSEYPEGHNWMNWRARIDDILVFFWGRKARKP